MLDIGWTELLLIGIVALIVVGPKDLPGMFRTLGKFTAKAKGMAREFQRSMEAAADEAGVSELQKDLKKVTNPKSMGLDFVKDMADEFRDPVFDPEDTKRRIEETKKKDAERRAKAEKDGPAEVGENVKALAAKREADKAAVGARVAAAREKSAAAKAEAENAAAKTPAARKKAARKPAGKAATDATATTTSKAAAPKAAGQKAPAAKAAAGKPAAKGAAKPATTRRAPRAKPKAKA